jgi:hypothetical protein
MVTTNRPVVVPTHNGSGSTPPWPIKADGLTLWERVIEQGRLTTRSSLQLLRVARTIADLNGHDMVQTEASRREWLPLH